MIYLLVGENQFRVDAAIAEIAGQTPHTRLDGASLSRESLVGALFSVSLFEPASVVVIDELSKQRDLWDMLPSTYKEVDGVTIVLREPHPDKRLKAYKWLTTHAELIDCGYFAANETRAAEQWLARYATDQRTNLTSTQVADMVRRALRTDAGSTRPVIDQQLLATAVQQLSDSGQVTTEMIDTVIAPSAYENVFDLLGQALSGNVDAIAGRVATMRHSEEGYMVLGLLVSQITQLTALVLAGRDQTVDDVAKAMGAHPFALRSMQKYATGLGVDQLAMYVEALNEADARIKTSSIDPWTAIDIALNNIALMHRAEKNSA